LGSFVDLFRVSILNFEKLNVFAPVDRQFFWF